MLIFGTKGRITRSGKNDTLQNACPQCSSHLDLSELKKWFTLYFIPVFPYSHVDTFYYCKECESSYKEEARSRLLGGKESQEALKKESVKLFAVTLIACLSYMAKADGEISREEEEMIQKNISSFKDHGAELDDIYKKVKTGEYDRENVYGYLRKASEVLTTEGILMLIAELARMILADGKIDKEEEKLMKNFMLICGVSEDLYETILDKVKK